MGQNQPGGERPDPEQAQRRHSSSTRQHHNPHVERDDDPYQQREVFSSPQFHQ